MQHPESITGSYIGKPGDTITVYMMYCQLCGEPVGYYKEPKKGLYCIRHSKEEIEDDLKRRIM